MPISDKDLKYYKEFIRQGEKVHMNMIHKNMPQSVISAYEGVLLRDHGNAGLSHENTHLGLSQTPDHNNTMLRENYLFIAVNRLLPSLFFQVPKPIIRANPGGSDFSAGIIDGLLRHYFTDDAKKENQMAILDAFMPYGFGCIKVGYNSRRGKTVAKKPNLFTGEVKKNKTEEGMEASVDFLKYENPYLERVSPKDVILDHTKPFGKDQAITFIYERTLQELIDSNLYNITTNFIQHFRAQGEGDNRQVKIFIKEHWVMIDNFAWKLVFTEDWQEPLAWGKTLYTFLPRSLLRFNKTPDTLYTISHGKLGLEAQIELNYQNELAKKNIDQSRAQTLVDENALTESGKKTLNANEIGGIVYTNRPVTQGVSANIGNQPLNPELFANIANIRQYLNLLIGTAGGRGGEQAEKLATSERDKAFGNILAQEGLSDSIRDFIRDQERKMVISLVKWGDPEITVTVMKEEVVDPETGKLVTGQNLQFGGKDGFSLKEEIQGKVELDYEYDVDMASAARPDFAVIRKQWDDLVARGLEINPLLQSQGKKFDFGEAMEAWAGTFDAIPNAKKIIKDMTEEEVAAFKEQQKIALMQEATEKASKGNPSPPTEAAIIQGAQAVATGAPGAV